MWPHVGWDYADRLAYKRANQSIKINIQSGLHTTLGGVADVCYSSKRRRKPSYLAAAAKATHLLEQDGDSSVLSVNDDGVVVFQ